ncbi:lipopolysaccharide biosynthesis protein [Lysobacter sp. 5GHs7-4]|uniref:lipopolysaccharide biosynthesis protein n=1 Tax=Lysobacter sp. 5GHs7-4 TaxID=2904253 RepID=UPI001E3F02CF|nr:lipopolysaccharide biosynthesis protein [Lysobacter sp. 5GHs7-4]UHQ21373.1 lipopolysaccharide biosynthesis protein [Lysobacter sp. 5GHs7-4]
MTHLLIGAVGTWLARWYALRIQLIDQPGERRSHSVATPRGGGIALVISLLVATLALAVRLPAQAPLLAAFGLGLALVAGVGLIDDHRPLSARLRLGVHALAAAIFAYAVWHVLDAPWLALGAFVAALVLTNVCNFMDGINGLAASQAALAALALGWLAGAPGLWLGLALAAACLGFLPFNFPRARIFMGDVGSGALGFALAGLAVFAAAGLGSRSAVVLMPLSAFLVDAGLTLLRRMLRRESWWTAHAQHTYQVWARRVGHTKVTIAYAIHTLLAVLSLPVLLRMGMAFMLCTVLAWYMSGAFLWWWLQRSGSEPVSDSPG